ncbi:type IV pilus modification protein PilV [Aromatoleum toluvorans]|uniref:Type IV pilus modification protein PilV n=1 Tax=Aromatoleum toluvorans TaxID=92002 RepID=A0ABX1Q259_9RHOO|nr:type IV pilus modification protein PilV [Aromatoleum toluvorans]NMG45796.1 type IV pilus modification protein PilV [Aromatoleum toluvorans]
MNTATFSMEATPRQGGFSLLEVLVSIVILAIGLLGLAGLQTKANEVEMEAYQRSVALMLVQDMADRVTAGRKYVDDFKGVSLAAYGVGDTQAATCALTGDAAAQLCAWSNAMKGAAEKMGSTGIGAPIGMRGCLISVSPTTEDALGEFFVVGVWQGVMPTASPPANTPGAQCAADVDFGTGLRRAVVTRVLVPKQTAG